MRQAELICIKLIPTTFIKNYIENYYSRYLLFIGMNTPSFKLCTLFIINN